MLKYGHIQRLSDKTWNKIRLLAPDARQQRHHRPYPSVVLDADTEF